ncbi:MAG: hypothetical protein A2Z64_05600 [Betaproteobacteria bacterium RIFCSPLOWO2_02_67_12]|nr:MAG: hypothetical protein A2Z64_05600 [Betaproteobacteria bacterium RIFCSPLOWO2_02_67_12]OGA30984.1 MAG: hypothetical protein A3I65_09350 [Betaproteobacteria bacterium RIFCSPLOWO2_02_FULL_68_150]OGA70695.1 MAG: hypothetical protein A3F77_03335 [Betaproteobacteria bacterium RIFCSPLOWO2_12_FULL_67_28]
MQLTILIGIALAIVAVAFALQNNVPVTVTFLLWRFDSTLAMVLLLAVAIGALIVAFLSTPSVLRLQWQAARQRKQIAALEQSRDELQAQLRRLGTGAARPGTETDSALAKMAPRRP